MNEISMRRKTTTKVMPAYPVNSVSRRSEGVAVATILVGRDGKIASCRVLEAPDDDISREVCVAVRQWSFQRITIKRNEVEYPVAVETKLTFYFRVEPGGRGVVAEPPVPPKGAATTEPPRFAELRENDFEKRLAGKPFVTLLDIRERVEFKTGHRANAVNIPVSELSARSGELATSKTVVIYCSSEFGNSELCQTAARLIGLSVPDAEIYVLIP